LETLVVIGLLAIIVIVGSTSFFNILKTSTKTRVVNVVKQNGDYAMGVMERMIRNAKGIEEVEGYEPGEVYRGREITIENPDGESTTFSCEGGSSIASDGASLIGDEVRIGSNCDLFFTVTRGEAGLNPDVVIIQFTLEVGEGAARPEERASVDFENRVVLRNLPE